MKKYALLIIDMQNDFVLPGKALAVAQAPAVIPQIRAVLDAFRDRRLPVFHVIRIHRPDGSDVEITRKDLFKKTPFAVAGSSGAAIIDELQPRPGEYVIEKARMSAFLGTELDLMLRTLAITDLVVAGIQTPNCIRTTVFDAIAYNYPVILLRDAVGAKNDAVHSANVADMEAIGVRVMAAHDLIAAL
ncbi:MAG TPA: isochorismatase family cysteine hydrolase [Methanoregulaceae archaeon]|nr:isochorismatase family cysteine hydrolase [Methanoregulaceae archaeon]